jgi:hypothetical protein
MIRLSEAWIRPVATVVGLALFLAPAIGLHAQEANPDVRAARLSYVEGNVQIAQGNQILASSAPVNTPLFEGTVITTKENGQAEIQFDDGTIARISPNSSLGIPVLRQQEGSANTEVKVQSGLAYLEFQGNNPKSQVAAHFGDSTITPSGFTVLRIDMDNPPGEVAVFAGNAHLERGNALSLDLRGGESVALNGGDPNQYNLAETIEPNSWDAWNADRDQELTSQQSAKTGATEAQPNSSNPAWSDLDANGNWYNVPGQGYVWSPNEAASSDWQPYGCGSWVWNPQYGYVWASCDSWGYMPYNSGSWGYYDGFGWGWAPGFGYPWWNSGIFVINIINPPFRFQPPHRPHGGPVHPHGPPTKNARLIQPNPVIAVNRSPKSPAPTGNPVRVAGGPATIAGNTVQPLRPLSPRPVYSHTMLPGSNPPGIGYSVFPNSGIRNNANAGYANRPGYSSPWAGTVGNGMNPNRGSATAPMMPAPAGTYRPPVSYAGGVTRYSGAPAAPPPPHVTAGGGGGHPGPVGGGGSAPHVSAGGGGGGGAHASSGGGGGHH